jgi:hypothetical protein
MSVDDVYVMQHVLATTAAVAAVTRHAAFVMICAWASVLFVFVFSVGLTCRL